ncbi:hypothetical protein [Pseudarthrobacter sp. NIBRBAC000502770]|uniref:hypothetical protein n=1 Tax=Pseudarthrobacter sp. NIBRBAC000502770 TaxID=2590785 RepID=UPI00113FD15A|nr:hypothetical protein [Pseudarthrobacter sp. NIBRBAC000502770]QDG89401.1 hypothetical protein NIBR502770_13605 [Pseudarthrobacter sp. NIBRBAC000502770]
MNQRRRKFVSMIGLLTLVLSLPSCSNDGGGGGNDPGPSTPPSGEQTDNPQDTGTAWYNRQGCPADRPVPIQYPENDDLYEGLTICYSGYGPVETNSVLSNHGDKVWAFVPGSLEPYVSHTDEAGFFRTTFLSNTSQKWFLAPGEVAQPKSWLYDWSPDSKQTTAWAGYKLAADRYKEMDQSLYLAILKHRDPKAGALASCAKSAGESVTSFQDLTDSSSALRRFSASLKATTTGSSCLKAVKDLDADNPAVAGKVSRWEAYTDKAVESSPTATKIAAAFEDIFKFCSHVNVPKIGC